MEEKYPQIALLKPGEIFIEWARVVSDWKIKAAIKPKIVLSKKEVNDYKLSLKNQYEGDRVELVYISK